jgi:hypothetical protein
MDRGAKSSGRRGRCKVMENHEVNGFRRSLNPLFCHAILTGTAGESVAGRPIWGAIKGPAKVA